MEAVKKPDNWPYAPPIAGKSLLHFQVHKKNYVTFAVSLDTPPGPNKFVRVPAGKTVVGKPRDFPSYGWDIDYGGYTAE